MQVALEKGATLAAPIILSLFLRTVLVADILVISFFLQSCVLINVSDILIFIGQTRRRGRGFQPFALIGVYS